MSQERGPRLSGERGASLILAVAFLVVVGAISGAVVSSILSGVHDRVVLDQVRDRQYAADGGIEAGIAAARSNMVNGNALTPCSGASTTFTLNSVQVQMACLYQPTLTTSHYLQRNVIFTAQCANGPKCPGLNVIIRAQVNFASPSIDSDPSIVVSRTYVQSWSVNE